jgi:hypothetical protein
MAMNTKILIFIFSMLLAATAVAAPTPSCYSGAWYNPSTSGNGFTLDVSSSAEALSWFTYHDGKQVWFSGQGAPTGDPLALYFTVGDNAFKPNTDIFQVGTVSFTPVSPGVATFSWSFLAPTEFCSGFSPADPFCSGTETVYQLITPQACE